MKRISGPLLILFWQGIAFTRPLKRSERRGAGWVLIGDFRFLILDPPSLR